MGWIESSRGDGVRDCRGWGRVLWNVGILAADEGPDAGEAHDGEDEGEGGAGIAEALAGDFAGGDAPLGGKEPDAVCEVPADGDHGDDVDGEHPGIRQLLLDLGEGGVGVLRELDAHEALADDVLAYIEDGDEA